MDQLFNCFLSHHLPITKYEHRTENIIGKTADSCDSQFIVVFVVMVIAVIMVPFMDMLQCLII